MSTSRGQNIRSGSNQDEAAGTSTDKYPEPLLIGFHEPSRAWLIAALTDSGSEAPRPYQTIAAHRLHDHSSNAAPAPAMSTAFWYRMPAPSPRHTPATAASEVLAPSNTTQINAMPAKHSMTLNACGQTPCAYSIPNPPSAKATAANHGVAASVAYR